MLYQFKPSLCRCWQLTPTNTADCCCFVSPYGRSTLNLRHSFCVYAHVQVTLCLLCRMLVSGIIPPPPLHLCGPQSGSALQSPGMVACVSALCALHSWHLYVQPAMHVTAAAGVVQIPHAPHVGLLMCLAASKVNGPPSLTFANRTFWVVLCHDGLACSCSACRAVYQVLSVWPLQPCS
jgi:hypothetical protein